MNHLNANTGSKMMIITEHLAKQYQNKYPEAIPCFVLFFNLYPPSPSQPNFILSPCHLINQAH